MTYPKIAAAVTIILFITGCEQSSQLAQQAASAIATQVKDEVKAQTDGVIDQFKKEANDTLSPLGLDAERIASSVKAQGYELASKAWQSNNWAQLDKLQGKTSGEMGLFTDLSPIRSELTTLLGKDSDAFIAALGSKAILEKDGLLYLLSPQAPPQSAAWLIIDTRNRKLAAGHIKNGQEQQWQKLELPQAVRQLQGKLISQ